MCFYSPAGFGLLRLIRFGSGQSRRAARQAAAQTSQHAAQQGAAPDRRQFGSFCSVSALLVVGRSWAAAGELSRCAARDYVSAGLKDFGRWNVVAFGPALSSVFSVAAAVLLVAGVLSSAFSWFQPCGIGYFALRVAKRINTRHNKALHPTAYSFGFPLVPRYSLRFRRRVSLVVSPLRAALS